ncbi:MAG: DNA-formamidopyrimidine glycosylase [Omnitrophica WOR_2 bacterium RBG_13_44_8]|nr:MAG: DNA-formamidopyrimidine glycosylase [Omnitrophica WOR_2 bacterium RBG_13_44_8]
MPELPEVETYRRDILRHFTGKILEHAYLGREKSSNISCSGFEKTLSGKRLTGIKRFGKMLSFDFEDDISALVHLMVSGRYVISNERKLPDKSIQVAFWFEGDESLLIRYLFLGFCRIYKTSELERCDEIRKLGIDPTSLDFSLKYFDKYLDSKKSSIKSLLLDQSFLSGIGNIYADEILFQAGISPQRKVSNLSNNERSRLYKAIIDQLRLGLKTRGATIQSYADIYGNPGGFQDNIKVHSKMGGACVNCKSEIVKIRVGGRGTYYCPNCQK